MELKNVFKIYIKILLGKKIKPLPYLMLFYLIVCIIYNN